MGVLGLFAVQWVLGMLVYGNPRCSASTKDMLMGPHRTIGAIIALLSLVVLFTGCVWLYIESVPFVHLSAIKHQHHSVALRRD